MRKKNGFVFMETIIVVSILSLTLVILFASYSYILRKSRERNTFDTTEMIYKTYYIKNIIDTKWNTPTRPGILGFINNNLTSNGGFCSQTGSYASYICDLTKMPDTGELYQVREAFEVEKIYYLNPKNILTSSDKTKWLNYFDATTIDYINNLGKGVDYNIMVVKYKKTYGKEDGTYEVFHSSMEV